MMRKNTFYKSLFIVGTFIFCNVFFSCSNKKEGDLDDTIKVFYFPNSSDTFAVAQVKKKRMHGSYIEYFPSKKVAKTASFIKGLKEGESKTYNEDGTLAIWEFFKEGKQDSFKLKYGSSGDTIRYEEFSEGKKNGHFKTFHDNGKPFQDYNYIMDNYDGKQAVYFPDGKLKSIFFYKNGNPGKGSKEYEKDGKEVKYDNAILMEEKDGRAFDRIYTYKFRLKNPGKKDKFYVGDLYQDRYVPIGKMELKKTGDAFEYVLKVPKGADLMFTTGIIAVTESNSGKELVYSKTLRVALTNF